MTATDKKEFKEIISNMISGVNARIESQNDLTIIRLDGIYEQLEKMNKNHDKHEKIISELIIERATNNENKKNFIDNRALTCPKNDEINNIKENLNNVKSIKKFVIKSLVIGGSTISAIVLLLNFILNLV